MFILTFMYIFILKCIHICLTIWHECKAFHDHTHVHTTVHKLYSHVVTPLSFSMTPHTDFLLCQFYDVKTSHLRKRVNFWVWDSLLPRLILVSLFCGLPPPRGSGITIDDFPNQGCSRVFRESLLTLHVYSPFWGNWPDEHPSWRCHGYSLSSMSRASTKTCQLKLLWTSMNKSVSATVTAAGAFNCFCSNVS